MKKKLTLPTLEKIPSLIIKIGLPLISLVFLYILLMLVNTPENEKAWLYASGFTMLENAVMSFTLIFCGAFLIDMVQKKD